MVDLNGGASSRNSMAVVHTMKILTNIQEDGACDRLGMEKCDTFAQLESQDIIFSIHKIVLIKWLLCELAIGLWQDKMDKKCFLGVNFSTCSNHHLFSTML